MGRNNKFAVAAQWHSLLTIVEDIHTLSRTFIVLQEWAGWSFSSFSSGHLEVGAKGQQ